MRVNMVEAREDLVKNTLYAFRIHALMFSSLHQLVEVAVHVLHANVELLAKRVQEDVESRNQMGMGWESSEKYNFAKFEARRKGFEGLFHRFDRNLGTIS